METLNNLLVKNGLITGFLLVGLLLFLSSWLSAALFKKKIPAAAIAIVLALILAYLGGVVTGGTHGLADIKALSGLNLLGGPVLRDFTIVATALGTSLIVIKQAGLAGIVSLLAGVVVTFFIGAGIAYGLGYTEAASMATIGAGACTFIVGPVTGTAVGASSDVIALSVAAGVLKSILVTIGTPIVAKKVGLDNPFTAMVYGGLLGTTSGVAAGLAATDPKLVPYGALTATFYTGLGCLLCPSVLFLVLQWLV